jgi:hypothetical protein
MSSSYVQCRPCQVGAEDGSKSLQAVQIKEVSVAMDVNIIIAITVSFASGAAIGAFIVYVPWLLQVSKMNKVLKQINEYFIADAKKHADEA